MESAGDVDNGEFLEEGQVCRPSFDPVEHLRVHLGFDSVNEISCAKCGKHRTTGIPRLR